MRAFRPALAASFVLACSRPPAPSADVASQPTNDAASVAPLADAGAGGALSPCGGASKLPCFRFDSAEAAFRHVLASKPTVLAVGEAHAQKGTEAVVSGTKRFTDTLLPIVAPSASDVVVELWAPDPKCQKEVKAVASAQKPVTEKQAATNQNEYVVLGTKAKELGMTPWLLRPTCDDFSALADAGADSVDQMLRLVKRLTLTKLTQIWEKNRADGGDPKIALAYGGALHNDLTPTPEAAGYSFGPELERLTAGRYVELDVIVPEYVKDSPAWKKLPWYEAWVSGGHPSDKATLFVVRERSFVLVLPSSK